VVELVKEVLLIQEHQEDQEVDHVMQQREQEIAHQLVPLKEIQVEHLLHQMQLQAAVEQVLQEHQLDQVIQDLQEEQDQQIQFQDHQQVIQVVEVEVVMEAVEVEVLAVEQVVVEVEEALLLE
jgi:hypothetical protein